MTNSRRSPTDWERKFFAGDPSALDDLASNVHDLTDAVLALLTGAQPWELEALALINEMQHDHPRARQAFGNGDLLACTQYVVDGITPKTSQLTVVLRKVLAEEFPVA